MALPLKKTNLNNNLEHTILNQRSKNNFTIISNNNNNNSKQLSLLELITISLEKDNKGKEYLHMLLNKGKTYEALEFAQALYVREIITEGLITKIAYTHFIKMQNSHINSKSKNELIQMYPKIEYLK